MANGDRTTNRGEMMPGILHILNDGPIPIAKQIIDIQSKSHEVEVVDLSVGDINYKDIVDKIFANDKVISW